MPLLRTGEKEQTRRDNFKNKYIKRKNKKGEEKGEENNMAA